MEAVLTALLGQLAGGRRHWVRVPQGEALPYIVLQRVSADRRYTMQKQTRLIASRVQIDVYAETYAEVRSIGAAIVATLSNYRGQGIEAIFVGPDRDLPAEDTGEVKRLFRGNFDITVHHQEG